MISRQLWRLAALAAVAIGLAGCSPFTRVQEDATAASKLDGSWTVLWSGQKELNGVDPRPTLVFDTRQQSVSGFDGCNRYQGRYAFVDGKMKAQVAGTRMACASDAARDVSRQMADLFDNGAEVVEVQVMRGRVLLLRNATAELRVGPTDALK